jgi:hypothetical protein
VEAETLAGEGWESAQGHAPGPRGGQYLYDVWGKQGTPLTFPLPSLPGAGPVYVWLRTWKRAPDTSPAFLSANGQKYSFYGYGMERSGAWVWERTGPYRLPADHKMDWTLVRPYRDDPKYFSAILLDTLALTADPTFDPVALEEWRADRELTVDLSSPPSDRGVVRYVPPGPGRYRCRMRAAVQEGFVDALGNPGLESKTVQWQTTK